MGVLVTVVAPDPWVDLDLAKAHLRVTTADEDDLISAYIAAACAWIDGPQGWVGRCFGEQTLEYRTSAFCNLGDLPIGPVSSVESIKFVDLAGTEQTVDEGVYALLDDRLRLVVGQAWPSARRDAGGIRVRFIAGSADVAKPVITAALLLVGHWFRNRMAVTTGGDAEMPLGVKALLGPYRTIRI